MILMCVFYIILTTLIRIFHGLHSSSPPNTLFFFLKGCVTPYMHNNTCNVARGMDLVITKSQYHTGEQSSRLRDFL